MQESEEAEKWEMKGIPASARESIQKHQEYRRKLVMQLPAMKYNRVSIHVWPFCLPAYDIWSVQLGKMLLVDLQY